MGRRRVVGIAVLGVVVAGVAVAVARHDDAATTASTTTVAPDTTTRSLDSSTTSATTTTTIVAPTSTVPVTVPLPDATSMPALLVATDRGCVRRVVGSADVVVAEARHVLRCLALSDGSVVAVIHDANDATRRFTRFVAGRAPADLPIPPLSWPLGSGKIGGRPVVFFAPPRDPSQEESPIIVYDVVSGAQRSFGFGLGPDSGATRATTDGRHIVASESVDLGVGSHYYYVDGTDAVGLPDLSSQMRAYPSRDVVSLVISPDGKRLAYLDGPSLGPDLGATELWALVVVDVATGSEVERTPLTTGIDSYGWLDFDGRWAIASRSACVPGPQCVVRPSVIVDTLAPQPVARQVPGAPGNATLVMAP